MYEKSYKNKLLTCKIIFITFWIYENNTNINMIRTIKWMHEHGKIDAITIILNFELYNFVCVIVNSHNHSQCYIILWKFSHNKKFFEKILIS